MRRVGSVGAHVFLSAMFFVSGFCGLLYQTVWLRLAFARFGVITPVVSVVISVFMLGLGLGSWVGGKYVGVLSSDLRVPAVIVYGAVELLIGLGAFVVPALFAASAPLLLHLGEVNSWSYLAGSGVCIFASVLPFSCAMGLTFPVALRFLEEIDAPRAGRFGRLYAFNTAGAVAGVLVTVYLLIELLGLHGTLRAGFLGNLLVAVLAVVWGVVSRRASLPGPDVQRSEPDSKVTGPVPRGDVAILLVTGFCSMGMEVGWVRCFTPVLEHAVYAFAFLLASYLVGHALGASAHTATAARAAPRKGLLVGAALVTATLPIFASTWEWAPIEGEVATGFETAAIAVSVGLFAAVLGWLTPMLVDEVSGGRPRDAGLAYAANIVGCMLGPLVTGYALLPLLGARLALMSLCIPLAALLLLDRKRALWNSGILMAISGLLVALLFARSFEEGAPAAPGEKVKVYRDYTATTIARDLDGTKSLFVNGAAMTTLSPITQMMAHLTFALHGTPPRNVLIICLGMGTTYRSALTWGVDVTVVELVPGVARAMRNFELESRAEPTGGRIVIDDGRRFLARTTSKFDIIIIDPPPPPMQPASSLLYSVEFYDLLKQHLNPGGIVQQWWGFPWTDRLTTSAMVRSVVESFPHVREFRALEDPFLQMFGFHFICSLEPVPPMSAAQFLERLPEAARHDLELWSTTADPAREMHERLARQLALEGQWPVWIDSPRITDDEPVNEYYFVRRHAWTRRLFLK